MLNPTITNRLVNCDLTGLSSGRWDGDIKWHLGSLTRHQVTKMASREPDEACSLSDLSTFSANAQELGTLLGRR